MPPSFAFCGSNAVAFALHKAHRRHHVPHMYIYIHLCPCLDVHRQLLSPHHKRPSHLRRQGSMGQFVSKKKGAGQAEQSTDKGEKAVHKSHDVKELIQFMGEKYDEKVKDVKNFDDFYHAIYEMIEMFCEQRGQMQYRIPERGLLEKHYTDVRGKWSSGNLTREQFIKLAEKVIDLDSFSMGQAAIHVLLVLFGVPACALLAKRFVPGLKSVSEDIVIPAATSGAVIYLAKANKL